jgi:hypothetical protein
MIFLVMASNFFKCRRLTRSLGRPRPTKAQKTQNQTQYFTARHASGGQARDAVLGDHIFNMNISRQDVDIKSIKIAFLVNKITDHFPFLSIGACFDLLYPL